MVATRGTMVATRGTMVATRGTMVATRGTIGPHSSSWILTESAAAEHSLPIIVLLSGQACT